MIAETLRKELDKALQTLGIEAIDFVVEHPDNLTHGDYATNVALIASKKEGKNPRELADSIVAALQSQRIPDIEKIEVAGAGFINFHLSPDFFRQSVSKILSDKNFGVQEIGKGKKIVLEFSSPNIAKPFTIGHFRGTIIGDSIARILTALGFTVIKDNHVGDWGTQFGKMISSIKRWGNEESISRSDNPVKELVALYVRFHEEAEKEPALEAEARAWFTKLEKGDAEARRLWKLCINWSLVEFNRIYKRLHVEFDTALGESFFEDKMPSVLSEIQEKKLAKESEGALLIFFPNEKYPPLMIRKSDGSTLYATRDLATDKYRLETYGPDLTIVNEVGMEQSLYFKQLFEAEKMLGWITDAQRVHVGHGLYRFKEGKMSTRKGNVIWLEDILEEAVTRAGEIDPESAEEVGIGAIKFNDLKREAKQDIVFNWEEVVNLKGDSGPYLQYSYARAQSLLGKGKEGGINPDAKADAPSVSTLERLLYRFPEIVLRSGLSYAPHYVANYLLELSAAFNAYYGEHKIVDTEDKASPYKLALTGAFALVMKNGLALLGISAPEKM